MSTRPDSTGLTADPVDEAIYLYLSQPADKRPNVDAYVAGLTELDDGLREEVRSLLLVALKRPEPDLTSPPPPADSMWRHLLTLVPPATFMTRRDARSTDSRERSDSSAAPESRAPVGLFARAQPITSAVQAAATLAIAGALLLTRSPDQPRPPTPGPAPTAVFSATPSGAPSSPVPSGATSYSTERGPEHSTRERPRKPEGAHPPPPDASAAARS